MATTAQASAHLSPPGMSWPGSPDSSPTSVSRAADASARPFGSIAETASVPPPSASKVPSAVQWGVAAAQGQRPRMEDTHVGVLDVDAHLGRSCNPCATSAFFGVFDGHAGCSAAEFARDQLLNLVVQQPSFPTHVKDALRMGFLSADDCLYQRYSRGPCSGCTALTAMVVGRQLAVAHAGDSRAVLSRRGKAIDLTHDHKPSDVSEKARVRTAGGWVCGPKNDEYLCSGSCCRGADARADVLTTMTYENSHLGVTRALGDFHLSQLKYRSQDDDRWHGPLIAEPEVHVRDLEPEDEFVILACDGLWDVLPSQRAVEIARSALRQHSQVSAEVLQGAAQSLVDQAIAMHSTDNVTALVVGLQSMPPVNRSFKSQRDRPEMSRALSSHGLGALAAALAQANN